MRKKENESAENYTEDEEWAKSLKSYASDAWRSEREGEGRIRRRDKFNNNINLNRFSIRGKQGNFDSKTHPT